MWKSEVGLTLQIVTLKSGIIRPGIFNLNEAT